MFQGIIATENYRFEITHFIYRQKALGTNRPKIIAFCAASNVGVERSPDRDTSGTRCAKLDPRSRPEDNVKIIASGYLVSLIDVI
mgnify:CR=1 FL=1